MSCFGLSNSAMHDRLTLDKVNATVVEMAGFADLNARLLAAPRDEVRAW